MRRGRSGGNLLATRSAETFSFASEQPLGSAFESRRLNTHNFGRRLKWDEMKRSRLYYALNSAIKFGFFVFLPNA